MNNTEQLRHISEQMRKQGNRCTQYPVFCIIERDKPMPCRYQDSWDIKKRMDVDYLDEDRLCSDCREKRDNGDELPEDCDHCENEAFEYYKKEDVINTDHAFFFLTEEACETHIRENDYHYHNPQSYVMSAWRNPEIVTVMQEILRMTGDDIPSCYQ